MSDRKRVDPLPEEFSSYEEAADFWSEHDTTDYPEAFAEEDDPVETELPQRSPLTAAQEEELVRRLETYRRDGEPGEPWREALEKIGKGKDDTPPHPAPDSQGGDGAGGRVGMRSRAAEE